MRVCFTAGLSLVLLPIALLPFKAHADSDTHRAALDDVAKRDLSEMRALLPGVYTNEEQVYFQEEMELDPQTHLPRLTLTITPDGDDFTAKTFNPATGKTTMARLSYRVEDGRIVSREMREGEPDCEREFAKDFEQYRGTRTTGTCGGTVIADADGFSFGAPDTPFRMLRAQAFNCWISPQKADGSYGFTNDILVHDQGGRAWVEGEGHARVGIKIRNVRWPRARNRDSLVLYTYRGDDADTAVSYAWTSPDSDRLAINLRWIQVSCTRGGDDLQTELVTNWEVP